MKVQQNTVAFLLLLGFASALSMKGHQATADFCWKDSYQRGVGALPSFCPSDREKIGLLCYSKCPAGYSRSGFDCQQQCPNLPGWSDQGLFCKLNEYGRGAGYPLQQGDRTFDDGKIKRCQADHGKGNCVNYGLRYYPKCKPGYFTFGCCICRPPAPDCAALGYNGNVDLSCAKKIIIGNPISISCTNGRIYDAGRCYIACQAGYNGVGPVCWQESPKGWIECGMGAAKDSMACLFAWFEKDLTVGNFALNIATFGTGKAAKITKDAAQTAKLQYQFKSLKIYLNNNDKINKAVTAAQGKFPPVEGGKSLREALNADQSTLTAQDIVRASAQIAAIANPRVTNLVSAKTYPKCSEIVA